MIYTFTITGITALFGRVVDQKWKDGAATVIDRYQYGYDCDSNRLWRENVLTHSSTTNRFDEFYTYDGLGNIGEI